MPGKQNDAELVLKNLTKALKIYTPKELNTAIMTALTEKHDSNDEIKFIKEQVSIEYTVTERMLIQSKGRGTVKDARKVCCWLLHYDLGLSHRYIANRIFGYDHHNRISMSIREFKNLKEHIKIDREIKAKYDNLRKKLLDYINAKKSTNGKHDSGERAAV